MNGRVIGKRLVLATFLVVMFVIVATISLFFIICRREIKSLASLTQIDEYGMYEMTIFEDYKLEELLQSGIEDEEALTQFLLDHLSIWYPKDESMKINIEVGECTAFFVQNDRNEFIYGRNFDFPYAPSLLLHTNPENGYKSISTVNLSCLGYNQTSMPKTVNNKEFKFVENGKLLAAPYLPYDGMNEMGVAISLISLYEGTAPFAQEKPSITSTTAVRLVLDRAANVEEAVALLSKYNIKFSNNIPCQFFIADSSGTSLIVEFINGKMEMVYPDSNYQIASNFIAYNHENKGYGLERYATVKSAIESRNHQLSDKVAQELLAHVGVRSNGIDMLQWSVLYNVSNLTGEIFAHRKFDDRTFFAIN